MRTRLIHWFRKLLHERYLKFTFSQFGEDIIISSIIGRQTNGTYVDIGAHHPRRYSNTYLLSQKGWRGVNIDPNRRAIRALNRERRRDVNIRAAVAAKPETTTMYEFRDHAFDTLSLDQARSANRPFKETTVQTITVADIFARSGIDASTVDFLNIDIEGLDLEVLRQFDFTIFKPKCVCIEAHGIDLTNASENPTVSFMRENGYRLHSYLVVSAIFCREDG